MKTTRKLTEVKIADTFKVADVEWIKFAEKDGTVINYQRIWIVK